MVRNLFFAALLAVPARAGESIEAIPPLAPPLSPAPVIRQLQIDLSVLAVTAQLPELPPSNLSLTPSAWANLKDLVPAAAPPQSAAAQTPTDALRRVELAQQILSRFEPGAFAELPDAKKDEVLGELWEGWKAHGLATETGNNTN